MKRIFIFTLLSLTFLTAGAQTYRNPIIPGFNPDPSICRVGDDFYVVNSSFQYFPGVPIYHSKDLVSWEQTGNVLDRESQLPLQGASSWLGIYAPTLRHHDGTWYMITTNVGNGGNFMVTATNPAGPWSDPVWLKQGGIDPSLLFEDGKCYMVSNPSDAITLCEIDPATGQQLTESTPIWRGTGGRYPEGPHIYKKDGYYYLLISEGGTELAHRLTIARSKSIYGPYEANPANPLLTHCSQAGQSSQIQGTGHGDLMQAPDGSWWMVFLAYRNFGGSYHHLGRETYLAPVEWKSGEWPVVNGGQPVDTLMRVATLPSKPMNQKSRHYDFKDKQFGCEWVFLQNPVMSRYQFRDGRLILQSDGKTLTDNDRPTFVGQRQTDPRCQANTTMSLLDKSDRAEAGLTVYQINDGHAEIALRAVDGQFVPTSSIRVKSLVVEKSGEPVASPTVRLRIRSDADRYYLEYATEGADFKCLDSVECSLLSTEVVGGFTGVTIGMYATATAAFDSFSYDAE